MPDGDLSDFGIGTNETIPPLVHRKNAVESPTKKGVPVGFVAHDRRRDYVVYTTRRKDYHYYKSGMGYAISDSVIDRLGDTTASRILIHEPQGNVYEFGLHQYANAEGSVPEALLLEPDDPQSYVPVGESVNSWRDHSQSLFVQPFDTAMERISARSWW